MLQVVLTAYNIEQWIERCLTSIEAQDLRGFGVTMVDDGSTDATSAIMREYSKRYGWLLLTNAENRKAPYSFWRGVRQSGLEPDDIVFLIDGDDFLPHDGVLRTIQEVYDADPYIWCTYGQYEPYPHSTGQEPASRHTQQECDNRDFRGISGRYNHPITFRYFLHQQLTEEDFKDDKGQWFKAGFDACLMWPILELAVGAPGERPHFEFLEEVLYNYNAVNPNSDAMIHVPEVEYSRMVARRPKRERLT